jgi:ribosomal protein L7/L12
MKYIFSDKRFTFFDACIISIMAIYTVNGQWPLALILAMMGVPISMMVNGHYAQAIKDKQWQILVLKAGEGTMAPSIMKYREIYECGLKEAVDAIRAYQEKL